MSMSPSIMSLYRYSSDHTSNNLAVTLLFIYVLIVLPEDLIKQSQRPLTVRHFISGFRQLDTKDQIILCRFGMFPIGILTSTSIDHHNILRSFRGLMGKAEPHIIEFVKRFETVKIDRFQIALLSAIIAYNPGERKLQREPRGSGVPRFDKFCPLPNNIKAPKFQILPRFARKWL